MLHARLKVRQVHTHIVAIKLRSMGKVVAKSFLPKEHEVVGLGRTLPTPPRGSVVEVIDAQGVWQEDCLLCQAWDFAEPVEVSRYFWHIAPRWAHGRLSQTANVYEFEW